MEQLIGLILIRLDEREKKPYNASEQIDSCGSDGFTKIHDNQNDVIISIIKIISRENSA